MATFLLIHSPLVGPITWEPVGEELDQRGHLALVPELEEPGDPGAPYWRAHAASAARAADILPADHPVILVAHSGAGLLMPAITTFLTQPVVAQIFVDAGIPQDGLSRLELIEAETPRPGGQFRRRLEAGERFPNWSEEDLHAVVPDPALRRQLYEQIRPRDLRFFEEPIPVTEYWPGSPCAYLHFASPYDLYAEQAQQAGWVYRKLEAEHFHMLVDPHGVAGSLLELAAEMGAAPGGETG